MGRSLSKSWRRYWEAHGGRGSPLEELRQHIQTDGPPDAAAARELSARLKLPAAAVRSLATYYSDLTGQPDAPRVCKGTSCILAGAEQLAEQLPDVGSSHPLYCLGYCDRSPVVLHPATQRVVAADPRNPAEAFQAAEADAAPVAVSCRAREPIVTERLLAGDCSALERARAAGVYEALREALRHPAVQIIEILGQSGLQGRGGAAFPTAAKWRVCAQTPADRRYVVVNGDEGDPGAFIDRVLMEQDPHAVLEGLALCAYAVGAEEGIVFVRSEYPRAIKRLRHAIAEARAARLLGRHLMESEFSLEVSVVVGRGSYVCGEESALLNAIESLRGEVRVRPPYPAVTGLCGKPTVINNVETLVSVPWILRHGAPAYAALGTQGSPGTKALCLNQGFSRPGIVEVEFGISLREVIETVGGGGRDGRPLAGVILGGPLGSILRPHEWDVPVGYPAMLRSGVRLGHGGLVAIPQGTDFRRLLQHGLEFITHESCGKCAPCRIGAQRALELVRAGLTPDSGEQLARLLEVMADASLCAFGQTVPRAMEPLLDELGYRKTRPAARAATAKPAGTPAPTAAEPGRDQAVIDGHLLEVRPGETVLDATRRLGIRIPTLCHSPGLTPEGGCRLCLVQSETDQRLIAACTAPLQPGMRLRTDTPRLGQLRRDVLALTLSHHEAGRFHANPHGNELEQLMARLGVEASAFGHHGQAATLDDSHPYLRFDPSRCITCRRCLNACEQIQGQFVYGIAGRGAQTRLIFGAGERFSESDCTACGTCVLHCPTGAISDIDRLDHRPAPVITESVCGYCGVGCRVRIHSDGNRVLRIDGIAAAAANRGGLCVKGRYGHAYHRAGDRLTRPLLRDEDGELRPVEWEQAVRWLAGRLREIRDHHGPDTLGIITSSRTTNEANYLAQKLFRTAIGTNNIDCCARICHASTALALKRVTGTGAATASYADIERARCLVVAGANPTEAHPVVGARIKQAVLGGAALMVIDPRRIELAEYADLHLPLRPGTNVALFNALAKLLIEDQRFDAAYVAERLEGFEELTAFTRHLSLETAARVTGLEESQIRRAAEILGSHGPTLFVHGLGLSELSQGSVSVMALCNLGMLTGSIGRPGAGMLPLRGQNNVQGNADMGSMPNQLTGYLPVDDPAVRRHLQEVWGQAPPPLPGKTIPEMIDAAVTGELRGLWVMGEDIAQTESHQAHVLTALRKLELVVVQDLFLCETARYAHLVLPVASYLEQDGTFTNGERRIQRVRPAVAPPGEARPDWQVVLAVARALGLPWPYRNPGEVMDEIAQVAPALFGGVSYQRLEGDGLQWPCPTPDHPGTATVHRGGFLCGKGRLVSIGYAPAPELAEDEYPYVLITGRILEHYNAGTMTRRTPSRLLVAADYLEIHAEDASREQIHDGEVVRVASRWGQAEVPVHVSSRVSPGRLFLSFHHPQSHTNRLIGPYLDPLSKCPDYKEAAVRLERRPEP